ncbi:MAG: cytochrome c biogenesis protein CcsA [Bacteroidia bacterium]|nr:cytochrome c biogenesis protein CcsA [Bacteroidia bacterium]
MRTWPGELGFALVDASLVAAVVAAIGLLVAWLQPTAPRAWARLGLWAFGVHTAATLGVLVVLLALIVTGQYQYHYPWSHASNSLELRFVVASLWEGQEGSFLIWMVWHTLLGLAIWRWGGSWRLGVLGVIATLQAVLASMILGVYLSGALATVLFGAGVLIPLGVVAGRFWRGGHRLETAALGVAGLLLGTNLVRGMGGFGARALGTWAYGLELLLLVAAAALALRRTHRLGWPLGTTLLLALVVSLGWVLASTPLGGWKVGSSPFLLLREALPDTPVFAQNPDFVPADGTGLNPLLQNYWMVIHPPTLFLGFALTLVPFAYVVAALLKGELTGWVKPASPWALAAVGVLGVGILMGGYWAYETLNFGGYWNWDPVENASLVPWLTGVAALHALLAYRHGRVNLRLAATLLVATFVLVLYSTFLVRSGILGEASVHSFTDLGLSGQLLLLLLGYLGFVSILLAKRWRELPAPPTQNPLLSRETFLLLAATVLTLAAVQVAFATSLPVINAVLGTNAAPPPHVPRYYYHWQVWFALAIGLLSAVGQYVFWQRSERGRLGKALFGPFVVAAGLTVVAMVALKLSDRPFVFNETYQLHLAAVSEQGSGLQTALAYLGTALLYVADELLLFAALFTVAANAVVLWRLIRRSARTQGKVGGSLAHIGFGLLLVGVVFSAGYETTVSVNLSPTELGADFPAEARGDNVLLLEGQPKAIPGYRVTYAGKQVAQAPIGPLRVVREAADYVQVAFADSLKVRYRVDVPRNFFAEFTAQPTANGAAPAPAGPTGAELERLRTFIETNLRLIEPEPLDGRTFYPITFYPLRRTAEGAIEEDPSRAFTLTPEAEANEQMGLISHPDTRHTLFSDLYVFVSSIPKAETDTSARRIEVDEVRLRGSGDSLTQGPYRIVLDRIAVVEGDLRRPEALIVLQANLRIWKGEISYPAQPRFLIRGTEAGHQDARIDALDLSVRFEGVAPEAEQVVLLLQQEIKPPDYLTFKALQKPLIGLVWLGAVVMSVGFAVAAVRRSQEQRAARVVE